MVKTLFSHPLRDDFTGKYTGRVTNKNSICVFYNTKNLEVSGEGIVNQLQKYVLLHSNDKRNPQNYFVLG